MKLRKRFATMAVVVMMMASMSSLLAFAEDTTTPADDPIDPSDYVYNAVNYQHYCVSGNYADGDRAIYCTSYNTGGSYAGTMFWTWTGSKGYTECASSYHRHYATVAGKTNDATADVPAGTMATTASVKPGSNNYITFGGCCLTIY